MRVSSTLIFLFFLMVLSGSQFLVQSCRKSEPAPVEPYGKITFELTHLADQAPLEKNDHIYVNSAGNEYTVTDLMYFISDITLYRNDGRQRMIGDWKDIVYIDDAIPSTLTCAFPDKISPGTYDSVSFVFGITEKKNESFMFVNPPEVFMAWPQVLGGGYHYMMLNGKWKDSTGVFMPFNFHLGIGQLYHGNTYNTDSIYAFVQNYFTVSLPGSSFTIRDGDSLVFSLTMHIDRWFDKPYIFDWNQWGGNIMQKQPAMQMARENGADVFELTAIHR